MKISVHTSCKGRAVDNISICMTLKNRADFIDGKLRQLVGMNYPADKLEICVTDGGSKDNLVAVLKKWAPKFLQVKYARSNRAKLPFALPGGDSACDINAQICNVASFEKVVRTDPEVRFTNPDSLRLVNSALDEPGVCLVFPWAKAPRGFKWPAARERVGRLSMGKTVEAYFCSAFRRKDFIEAGGIDERFAKGFAGEDTYFHWWWMRHRKLIVAPNEHLVVHLWHGDNWTPARRALRARYTFPLIAQLKREDAAPNEDNPAWPRSEMIEDMQVWTG